MCAEENSILFLFININEERNISCQRGNKCHPEATDFFKVI